MSDSDPYLWLEDVTGDDALAWVRQHNQLTIDTLTATERFSDLQSGALEVLDTDDRIAYVRRRGEHLYNYWRDAANPRGLWRRTTLEEYRTDSPRWDVLINLDAVATEEGENWVWKGALVLRPDHRRALILLSRGGADASIVREFDMVSRAWITADDGGFTLPENKSDIGWIDEDTVYVGTDFGEQPDGRSALTNSGYPRVVKRWTRGTLLEQAATVYTGATEDVAVQALYDDTIGFERHFLVRSTDFFNQEFYELEADETTQSSDSGSPGLRLIDVPTDAHTSVHRDWLLVFTRSPWQLDEQVIYPTGTLLVFDFDAYKCGSRDATILFSPDAHTSLQNFSFTSAHLVLVTLRDVQTKLRLLSVRDWSVSELSGLPELATISVLDTDPDHSDELFLSASSFTTPPSLLHGSSTNGVAPIKQSPALFDTDNVSAAQYFSTSEDGTQVPYFVVKRNDVESGPTLLYGYGGFENSMTPAYGAISGRSWIEGGGIYVIANIRGGGEYGPTWHTQTQLAGRHLVYEDFASVATDLVTRGLTTPQQLAAQGGSNGGLLMGVMLTSYPELFGALVCQVPLLDMKRYHLLLAGASWVAEYGDPDDPEQWEFISRYSPYQLIRKDATYPDLLMTTSTRDDRVHPGHARKFVARLEEYGHTVSYYENIEGGHGGAADNKQAAFKSALAYEFLWDKLGG